MTMDTPSGSRMRALLLGSVGLNLFLAGALVPHLLRPAAGDVLVPAPAPNVLFLNRGPGELLPAGDAAVLAGAGAPPEAMRRLAEAMENVSEEVRAALTAAPFDPAALAAALTRGAEARRAFETAHQESMLAAVAKLSPEGRARLAEWEAPIGLGALVPPGAVPVVGPMGAPPPGAIQIRPGATPMVLPLKEPPPGR